MRLSFILSAAVAALIFGACGQAPQTNEDQTDDNQTVENQAPEDQTTDNQPAGNQPADEPPAEDEVAEDAPDEAAETDSSPILAMREWSAWIDLQPPGPSTLYVTGEVQLPHPGYTVSLTRGTPQGINPAILMLDLEIEEQDGMHAQVLTWHPARYEEPAEAGQFSEITIFHDGTIVNQLPVTEAQ